MKIQESNKLIAEFMGGRLIDNEYVFGPSGYSVESLLYHSSWDWLMPVVEKIELLGYNFNVESRQDVLWKQIKVDSHVSIDTQKAKNIKEWSDLGIKNVHELFIIHYFNSPSEKFEAIYKSVVKFIKWYNKNKAE